MSSVVRSKRGRSKGNVSVNTESKAEKERRLAREREIQEQKTRDIEAGFFDPHTGRRTPRFEE